MLHNGQFYDHFVYDNERAQKAKKILASMIADYIRKNDISKQQSSKTNEKEG
ncbi:hypothetical protein HMPREF0083_04532 [Aneurinibacillus aneurinilyticus ATCC 12856]|jgi:hypothetical protein|uniref:Uncharacterized protein n=1 Tax=Aneurinibacillus aneurinilyticus ATCC 12856 TaxID=649747 RepID=U1Y9A4_ANEAE|nr:hypothetical protein HMPREF0083_04532 [Aneurinibacillus aneurinilyticus ATCC 12856]